MTFIFIVHLSFYAIPIPLLIYDVMYDITTIPLLIYDVMYDITTIP